MTQLEAETAIKNVLTFIGYNTEENGLQDTPKRFIKALQEMTDGRKDFPEEILSKIFSEPCDELIILRNITFTSLCEHHLLPFTGTVDIGYLPGKVVGLSKLARLVECYAKRLQIQERLTQQIAKSIERYLQAQGVAVVVKGSHSCMGCRGVRKPEAEMITSCMLGIMRTNPTARAEFLQLCK